MLWPFAINWIDSPTLRLEWLTQVQQSKDDTELVTQLRTGARRTLRFQTLVANDAERVMFENMVIANQADTWQLPWWPHQVWITAAIDIDDTVIAVTETTGRDFVADMPVALVHELRIALATVESVSANAITLTEGVDEDWPVGTKIVPVFDARIQSKQPLRYLTDNTMTADVEFTAIDEWIIETSETADYLGYSVLSSLTEFSEDLLVDVSRNIGVFDNQTGKVHYTDISGYSRRTRSHRFFADADQLLNVFDWLAARAGRYKPFWQPTNQQDFKLLANISNVAVNLTVANWRHTESYGQPGRNHIMIKLRNGTVFYRRITNIAVINATSELVTINSALGSAVAIGDIETMCYLQLMRLSSDSVEIAYETDMAAIVALGFTNIREVAA